MKYTYLGDKMSVRNGQQCDPAMKNGKCIRGRNGNMLVIFEDGTKSVIIARRLRKNERHS